MGFTRYICPKFEEEIKFRQVEGILEERFLPGYSEKVKRTVKEVFEYLNEQPYNIALIDGPLRNTPSDSSYSHSSDYSRLFRLLNHFALTAMPYVDKIETVSPLVQLIRHDRVLLKKEDKYDITTPEGEQHFLDMYCEQNYGVYSAESLDKITPAGGFIGRMPKQPSGMPLQLVLNTLNGLERITSSVLGERLPWGFSTHSFYLFEKDESNDIDYVKDFIAKGEIVFSDNQFNGPKGGKR